MPGRLIVRPTHHGIVLACTRCRNRNAASPRYERGVENVSTRFPLLVSTRKDGDLSRDHAGRDKNMETGRANMETGKEKMETAAAKIATDNEKLETGGAKACSAGAKVKIKRTVLGRVGF